MHWSIINRIKASEFARNVSILATGSFFAQLITLAASPILTRLYGPEAFAAYALFVAIFSVITPAAGGRYEIAMVVAEDPSDRKALFVLSIWICGIVSLVILLSFSIFYELIGSLLNSGSLGYWLLLTPLALFLNTLFTTIRYYANSLKAYNVISKGVIVQAAVMAIAMIGCGWAGWGLEGLIIGLLIGLGCAALYMIFYYRRDLSGMEWMLYEKSRAVAKRYKDMPLYGASTSFLDAMTVALPVFFLTKYYPESYVGYYSLLVRVAVGPLSFVGQAVSQVHLKKVSELVHAHGDAVKHLLKTTCALAIMALSPTLIILFYAPELFQFVFGSQWQTAGVLLVILMPALALRFVVSTVSNVFASTGNNHLAAMWKVAAFLVTLGMFVTLAGKLQIYHLFLAMMITDLLLYGFYYYLILLAVKRPRGYT